MRIGVDTFSIRELKLNPFQTLDWLRSHKFEGAQFGGVRGFSASLDTGKLREVRAHADSLGLYSHVSVGSPNWRAGKNGVGDVARVLTEEIRAAAQCGWHELHSSLGSDSERYRHTVPWKDQIAGAIELLRQLAPVLRDCGSRINLETHGDTTTFELARIAEAAGPDICGICLDTANMLCFAEDPVAGARRAAPYTHLTHTKDAFVIFNSRGLLRHVRPPGQGALDWEKILPILAQSEPDLPLSIEDHKWLFEIPIFEPDWHAQQADLPREELAAVAKLAWSAHQRLKPGEAEAYEAIPYTEQLEARLSSARDYLAGRLNKMTKSQAPKLKQ